jgi:3-hydroxyacyl-CoA dehydrogenase
MRSPEEEHEVGIVGIGTMGGKIAESFLANGYSVLALARSAESGRRGLQLMERGLTFSRACLTCFSITESFHLPRSIDATT